jgi:hypothetical protein
MQPGIIVAYRERGHLALGIIEKVAMPPAKAQVELIGEDGKKSVLAPDRELFESRTTAALSLPLADLKKKLQELRSQISGMMAFCKFGPSSGFIPLSTWPCIRTVASLGKSGLTP